MPPSPSSPLRAGDVLNKKYEIEGPVGTGLLGPTYAGKRLADGRKVAVKVLVGPAGDPAAAAEVAAKVRAANADALVPLVDVGQHEGRTYVVHEFVEAETLRKLMDSYTQQKKSFTLQEACQIVVRLLEAAESAHGAGLIHRYIKPSAVLIATRAVGPGQGKTVRTIKLAGLGVADFASPAAVAEATVESPDARYIAPELSAASSTPASPNSDVYSIGVIFYELLCGQTPQGTYLSPTQIRDDLPEHVDDIVELSLAPNAEDRYPTARDMINDVQRTFTDEAKVETQVPRRQIGLVMGAVGILAVALVGYVVMHDPMGAAKRQDAELRAQVVKENVLPPPSEIQKKLEGHPGMQYIPAGTFIRGRMNAESGAVAQPTEPLAKVEKVDAFYMDIFEMDNAKGGNPRTNVTWEVADQACAALGKRLCSAVEWERACKGPENTIYSYGDTYNSTTCGGDPPLDADKDNHSDRPSGNLADCKSGWGVYDLGGGPAEWTGSAGASNPRYKIVKGGKQGSPDAATRCAWGGEQSPTFTNRLTGFRCCMSDDGSLPHEPVDPNALPPADAAAVPPAP